MSDYCKDCKWFSGGYESTECRAFPPSPIVRTCGGNVEVIYPPVGEYTDSCRFFEGIYDDEET